MDLTISPARISSQRNNINFGMASFTDEGLRRAEAMGDVYEPLKKPNKYYPSEYFEQKRLFRKAPFAQTVEKYLPAGKKADSGKVNDVAQMIVECGTSGNAFSNSRFIRQLITTKDHLNRLPAETQEPIRVSVAQVLAANWDNPEITDKETRTLAEMALGAISEKEELALNGALDKARAEKVKKHK